MGIRIFPNTGADHVGFTDDDGRRYIIDRSHGPRLETLAAGASANPLIVSADAFAGASRALKVTSVGPNKIGDGFEVHVASMPHDLKLTPVEVMTLADQMIMRSTQPGYLNTQ